MNKIRIALVLASTFMVISVSAQEKSFGEQEFKPGTTKMSRPSGFFKALPTDEKSEQFDIIGLGAISFSASNTADGTPSSYNHSGQISIPLILANNKTGYQIVFYTSDDQVPYTVEQVGAQTNVYFPLSFYDALRAKLEQSIAARKKVQLKLNYKKTGFREGVIQF